MLNIGRYENYVIYSFVFDKTKYLYSHENWTIILTSNDVMSNDVITFYIIKDVIKF